MKYIFIIIYNNPNDTHDKQLLKNITLLSISFAFYSEINNTLYAEGFYFLNFWTAYIIFLLFFMKLFFIINIYKHHKMSIIFIVSICSILILVESFLPSWLSNEKSENSYQNIKNKLGSYFYSIIIIILFAGLSVIYYIQAHI